MTETEQAKLKLEILRELDLPSGMMMPEPTLHSRLRCLQVHSLMMVDLQAAMKSLEESTLIIGVRSTLGLAKWRISDAGRAELAQYQ